MCTCGPWTGGRWRGRAVEVVLVASVKNTRLSRFQNSTHFTHYTAHAKLLDRRVWRAFAATPSPLLSRSSPTGAAHDRGIPPPPSGSAPSFAPPLTPREAPIAPRIPRPGTSLRAHKSFPSSRSFGILAKPHAQKWQRLSRARRRAARRCHGQRARPLTGLCSCRQAASRPK